ncbi:MAG: hypothetical protein IPI04_19385 [Ignavibacteria bacterium]|nr:hypothetical protein [Ignavibacteria bacterium]
MKQKSLFIAMVILMISCSKLFAQNPAFYLSAKNFLYTDSLGDGYDALTFEIIIEHTNLSVSGPFEFALGQYYFNFNSSTGITSADYTYYIVPGSTQFTNPNAIPRNPTIVNPDSFSPLGATLRVNSNTVLGAGSGPIVATYPGTRVCTMRIKKKSGNFPFLSFNMEWRKTFPHPTTKIFAYVGTINTEISGSSPGVADAYVDTSRFGNSILSLINPVNNSLNNPTIVDFSWHKDPNAVRYQVQVATDSLFTDIFYEDQYVYDTTITLGGFTYSAKYFWKVKSYDIYNNYTTSQTWNFKIQELPTLKLKLTAVVEGMYYNLFNLLSRRDTVTVELRQTVSPYTLVASSKGVIDSLNFNAFLQYPFAPAGTYYIVFKHLNSISTWSKSGGVSFNFNDTAFYNFTTSSTQAYGNNLKLKGSKYCVYSGDINQSGFVDATDMSILDNDAYNLISGRFLPSDLNGDNIVDGADMSTGDNNSYIGAGVIKP